MFKFNTFTSINSSKMKNITSVLLISSLAMNTACTTMKNAEAQSTEIPAPDASLATKPFMKKSSLQYQAPEFDKIKDEHFKPNVNISARNVAAKIFAKDFSKIEASSSADIKIKDKFTQDKTDIEVSSSAGISGDLEANDLSIEVSSSGTFSGQIWAVNLSSEVNSSGDIKISGKTKNAALDASSSGTLNAQNVIAENAEIETSSSGSVSVSVSRQLNASASSSGDISVTKKGNINIISQKESSGGSVTIN